jgi:putative endopeptidase
MRNLLTFMALCFFAFTLNQSCKPVDKTAATPGLDPKNMDTTVNSGEDFFKYANGGWMKNHPVPADKSSYGAFDELDEANRLQIKELVLEAAKRTEAANGSNVQKIRDFYSTGMDTIAIEKMGIGPLTSYIQEIDKLKSLSDLPALTARFSLNGASPFFYLFSGQDAKNSNRIIAQIWQGGLGLPERDYYLNDDERSKEIRNEYQKHIQRMLILAGETGEVATAHSQTVINIETRLAKASNSMVENRNPQATYNLINVSDLQSKTPSFSWNSYLTTLGFPGITEINVCQMKFITELDKILKSEKVENWKVFLRWKIIHEFADYLPLSFEQESFAFYGKFLSGQDEMKPRWKRVLDNTSSALGEVLGQLYVEKYFPAEAKERMLKLVTNLKSSLKGRIANLPWMGAETRNEALAKLEKINVKIGYPDKWRDYSSLNVGTESYLANMVNSNRFETKYTLNKIGKPVDRNEWGMTPQTVNAYYDPNMNEIVFPAAILQPPFFNMNADDAVNYGAIGVVIGHEISHGFDDQGRQFDKDGNMRDWWTATDAEEFGKRTQLLINHFNEFIVKDTFHVNGELTLGENIADFAGLTISYDAFQMTEQAKNQNEKLDGFSPNQRFFLGYAQVWRRNVKEKALLRQLQEDVHSPAEYRVNGGLFNIPAFYQAFPEISSTSKLFRTEELRPVLW